MPRGKRVKRTEKKFPPLPRDPQPMMIINELAHIMRKSMTEKSRQLFGTEVCRDIMRELAKKDGVTQLDLVKITYYAAPSISVSLQKLEEKGYVYREEDKKDRRAIRVYITEQGKAANLEMYHTIKEFSRQTMVGISEEAKASLIDTLLVMRMNVLPYNETEGED